MLVIDSNLSLVPEAFCKALQDTDSKGLFSDILRLLMVAVFNLQEEEEEDLEGEMDVDEADHKCEWPRLVITTLRKKGY